MSFSTHFLATAFISTTMRRQ